MIKMVNGEWSMVDIRTDQSPFSNSTPMAIPLFIPMPILTIHH
jgi:hypothetical protein